MLDGLLGKGFAAKCKSLIKLTKSRIDVIMRKRRATEKFLKKDIADLLLNGLDINAYGRAEGLLVELTLSSCYGFVEKCCDLVLKHLSVMRKLSGCPEESRVAVSSLMFAAARFSDLPELRDLRHIFQERYGNSLECYVNQEFAANLNFKSSTLEKKVYLMQEIASEFSINWDSKAFKIRMSSRSSPFAQNGKEEVTLNRDDHDLQSKSTVPGNVFKPLNGGEVLRKRDDHDNSLTGRQEVTAKKSDRGYWKEGRVLKPIALSSQEKTAEQFEGGSKLHDSWGNTTPPRESQDTTTARKSPSRIGSHFRSNVKEPFAVNLVGPPDTDKPERKVQNDETPLLKPCYSNAIPPPYVKPNPKQQKSTIKVVSSHADSDVFSTCPSALDKSDAASMSDQDWQASRHERLRRHDRENEFPIREDAKEEVPMVKPKSMRRKHSRSRSSYYDAPNEDTELVRKSRSRSRRRDESRRGLRNLLDDEQYQNAKEERIIDKLLIHYSKKPAILVPEKLRKKSNNHHAHLMDNSARELLQNGGGDGCDETPEMLSLAPRSVSLPREQHTVVEVKKAFARAATFQPDRSYEARHVHPKLPDYDDLAARFSALRGI